MTFDLNIVKNEAFRKTYMLLVLLLHQVSTWDGFGIGRYQYSVTSAFDLYDIGDLPVADI